MSVKNLFLFLLSLVLLYFSFPVSSVGSPYLAFISFIPLLILMDGFKKALPKFIISTLFFELLLILLFQINPFQFKTSFYAPGNLWGTLFILLILPLAYSLTFFMITYFKHPLTKASLWTLGEILILKNLFHYPLSLGITQVKHLYFLQVAALIGIYGLSFLLFYVNTLLFDFIKRRKIKNLIIIILILLFSLSYGYYRLNRTTSKSGGYKVGLIQPNYSWNFIVSAQQNSLIQEEYLKKYLSLIKKAEEKHQPDLIVLPEGAIKSLHKFKGFQTDLLYGGFSYEPENKLMQNSVFFYSPRRKLGYTYHKERLAPFFETSLYTPGQKNHPFYLEEIKIGPSVCFESLFSEISRAHVLKGANFLITISNDSFFEGKNLLKLHAVYSIMRAVEYHRPTIFLNNNGFSLAADPKGRLKLLSPYNKSSISSVSVHPTSDITIFYRLPYLTFFFSLVVALISITKEVSGFIKTKKTKGDKNA